MSGAEAIESAVADAEHGRCSRSEAVARVRPDDVVSVLHAGLEPTEAPVFARGLAASPGAGAGAAYFDADLAADAVERGEAVVLFRPETTPADVHGMALAEAVVTSRGGLASHAAVVARGWGKPAVCGADGLSIAADHAIGPGGVVVREGDPVTVDGTTGVVYLGHHGVHAGAGAEGVLPAALATLLGWADELRAGAVAVRANADTADDAALARRLGAEGIGLCRTEHLFLGERLPIVRRVLLAASAAEEAAALDELLDAQLADLVGVLEAMDGRAVSVRLLDPPVHEFLPDRLELARADARGELDVAGVELLRAVERVAEQNPMLGLRGVRLGIARPGLYRMQARALGLAVEARLAAGGDPRLEILVPLVSSAGEFALVRCWIDEELDAVLGERRRSMRTPIAIGPMIETPRAALAAGELAAVAELCSFGTNDLTQLTFGLSRDDVAPVLEAYLVHGLLPADPFETLDVEGVGALVRTGVERGRDVRPGLRVGVCGEHAGDPESLRFFVSLGLDSVSCSPWRVPVARLAVAQALRRDAA